MQKAIIYCRVSSQRQVDEGNGNQSQEQRCRQYAQVKDYIVEKVFPDEGVSGGLFERPAMINLIAFLDRKPDEKYVVIFDDLSRFARDLNVHLKLRTELKSRNVKLECLNFNFEDSPEGVFIENVLASKAQLDREQNKRQVVQRMKARLELGYWPFCYPPGLINISHVIHGRVLAPHEPKANIFKEAIESYRDGLLNTLQDVQEFINRKYQQRKIDEIISIDGAQRILTNVLYCGWIEYKPWGILLKKGRHEGFITKETYDAVLEKLESRSKAPLRKDYNLDFPLRGFILCSSCQTPVTASWHKGRTKKYAHYFCKQKDCYMFGKVAQRGALEGEFEALIKDLAPNIDVLNFAKGILADIYENRDKVEGSNKALFIQEVEMLEAKKKQFMDRITNTNSDALVREYEKEVESLLKRKEELEDNLPVKIYSQENFGTASELVFNYLENPVAMWQSPNYKDKRLLLEMYFEEKLAYDLKEGFGTATLACLPKLLCIKEPAENHLVEMPGFEPGSRKTLIKIV